MVKIVGSLVLHVIGGAIGFMVIASLAVVLNWGVKAAKTKFPDVDGELFLVITGFEYLILLGDLILFIVFMIQATLKFHEELKEWRKS